MNKAYLENIIRLYAKNEKENHYTVMTITKKNDVFEFAFSVLNTNNDKTIIALPNELVIDSINEILSLYRSDKIVIDETNKGNLYQITFNNGRILCFNDFSLQEINHWRNNLYNISIRENELRVSNTNFEKNITVKNNFQFAGFTSFMSLTVIVMIISCVLFVSLFVCSLLF